MQLLTKDQYKLASPMLSQFAHQTVISTILSDDITGHIYANNLEKPEIVFAQFKHRCFIMGDLTSVADKTLKNFFMTTVTKNCRQWDVPLFRLSMGSQPWVNHLEQLLEPLQPITVRYQCYQYLISSPLPEVSIPEGFSIQQVTTALIETPFEGKKELLDEMCSERESVDAFLENSFGLVAFQGETLAGWCLSEYNHKNQCEVGIATMMPFQKQGLGRTMARAFINLAGKAGIDKIMWHCFTSNEASWRTALSAGFALLEEEPVLMVYLDQALNFAIHGNLLFEKRDYKEALVWYHKALSESNPQAWMAWNAACAAAHSGKITLAFDYLHQTIDLGFTDLDYLVQSKHMDLLKKDKRWGEIITHLNNAIHS